MAYTTFYTGSLRYDHTGRKRKNHCANPVKKKNPAINFTKVKIDPVKAEEARLKAEQRQKDKEDFLNRLRSLKKDLALKKEPMQYTGERKLIGIATMHKSNAVPIFESDKEHAKDIAKMRR